MSEVQRYKIGYAADDWGMLSSTPSGLPDSYGSWVKYSDYAALAALAAAPAQPVAEPLKVFSKGPWTFRETGQDFSGADLDEAAFVAYRERASRGQAPAGVLEDAARLDWLLWKLPGDSLRYVVGDLSDTSDAAEFRAAIDAARKQGANHD